MNATAASLLTICRRLLDADARPVATHGGHNGTTLLRATTRVGEVIVKPHRGPDRHRQEIHAYQHWTPALHEHAPELLATTDDPPAIIITALTGQPLAETCLSPAQETHVYRQAGELLHVLHHAGPSRFEPDVTAWLAERGEQWLALAADVLPARRRAEIRAHLHALAGLAPLPAVPCHLDYTPRYSLMLIDQVSHKVEHCDEAELSDFVVPRRGFAAVERLTRIDAWIIVQDLRQT